MNGVTHNTLVYVEGGDHHNASMFGGSDISGNVNTSQVVVNGGQVGNVYGGGNGNYDYTETYSGYTAPTCVTSQVDILVGQVGATGNGNNRNVFGGGYGHETSTTGNVTVNVGVIDADEDDPKPTIYGDIYGGSALGNVNTNTDNTTTVNILNGTLNGNVYGGGLGAAETNEYGYLVEDGDVTEAFVNGKVHVNIGNSDDDDYSNYLTINGIVFGGNNLAGTPKGDVYVDVYRTAHTTGDGGNTYPSGLTLPVANSYFDVDTRYALNEVYGGGNLANYVPTAANASTYVHVHNCDNTIQYVYGSGNAANVPTSNVIIDGGLVGYVFGGGNGYDADHPDANPGANVTGNNTLALNGGVMGFVFGGSNAKGGVEGETTLSFRETPYCSVRSVNELYGGGNQAADMNGITLNVPCGTSGVKTIYGGAKAANVNGNITLNVKGGQNLEAVYGGNNIDGIISGDVTLNLYGGQITDAFGGNNAGGNIKGKITVNVLDYEAAGCGLDVTNIYGASNATSYEPDNSSLGSPVINVIHIKKTDPKPGIRGSVYGGGNNGNVLANPIVNIGYTADMSSLIPDDYPDPSHLTNYPCAYVNENVYGGCNTSGTVTGNIAVNANGGTVGNDLFGGGRGNLTATQGNVTVTIDGATIMRDVYGGSALGQVNNETTDLTKVWLMSGTVTRNLYGGGMGQAGQDTWGQVNGQVEVHVNGGTIGTDGVGNGNVFGCNNYNEAPEGTVKVYINELNANTNPMTIYGNVYGGGNLAAFGGTTEVYIQNGTITHQVFGGGNNITTNNAGVGNANVQMTGGTVLGGIFGGCNTDGDVTGNVTVTLTGGTIGATNARSSIHGGGYGNLTTVTGNVTVTFGEATDSYNENLILYGDLYGGSALGSVNTNVSNKTTVNVYNGTIEGVGSGTANYGNVFGGGLGDADYAAAVNGEVYVNIGSETTRKGKASLIHCNVFGCNNQNGSPQADVFVNVYNTNHITTDGANYFNADRTYAIYQVFGGGNRAHYAPENNNANSGKKAHVRVYDCDNTIQYVYGGSNAANAVGVSTIVEGGRFSEIYGGGNGRETAADIGLGGVGINVLAGNVGFLFEGSNKNGVNHGPTTKPDGSSNCAGGLFVDSYFFGTNEAELYFDLDNTIECADAGDFEYRYVFAGSRWGIVYGNIKLTVQGGIIENLFGGCRGYEEYSADVRRFPTFAEIYEDYTTHNHNPEPGNPQPSDTTNRKYSYELRKYMQFNPNTYDPNNPHAGEPSYVNHGGNIDLIINGGTIGSVFGGCDIKGNVEGRISVTVSDDGDTDGCSLFVGNVYGASNLWYHNPDDATLNTPMVKIVSGTIGGSHNDLPVNNIYGNPVTEYAGNVYGGGNRGDVTANPKVIIGDGSNAELTINGNVYGGGNEGIVMGSTQVIIVPDTHSLTVTNNSPTVGTVTVIDTEGGELESPATIGEGTDVYLTATPKDYTHSFSGWTVVSGTGASIASTTASSTTFTMGTTDAEISASFASIASSGTITYSSSPASGGTVKVVGFNGNVDSGTTVIGQGTVLNIVATPSVYGYKFKQWTVTNGTVSNATSATTTFTMGSGNAIITAEFVSVPEEDKYALTITPPASGGGSFKVKDHLGNEVSNGTKIGKGAVLNLVAESADATHAFSKWTVQGTGASVSNQHNPETTFTMGQEASEITASFATVHTFKITSPDHGTIRVTDALGHVVNDDDKIGEGAMLNLKVTPAPGWALSTWTVSGEGSTIANATLAVTSLTMGTADVTTIEATFIPAHILTVIDPETIPNSNPTKPQGTIKVTGSHGQSISSPASVGENVVLDIVAVPAEGYIFSGWTVTGTDSSVTNPGAATTKFTMGTENSTIKATFTPKP